VTKTVSSARLGFSKGKWISLRNLEGGETMSSFSTILDPTFEDLTDPFKGYDAQGEPLEDKLYLPCGIDPAKKELGVVFVHPYPQNNTVLEKRIIRNLSFSDANWLIETGVTFAAKFSATPIYIFEATGQLWVPLRRYIHQQGYPTATVCALQTNHARKTRIRKSKNDLIDAINIVKVFKNGESHASRMPHPVIANLREYMRLHLFFSQLLASIANRIHGTLFISHPEFEDHFSKTMSSTAIALMILELAVPENILACPMEKLTQIIEQASRGRLGKPLAQALRDSAHTTFAVPFATEALSFSMRMLASVYEQVKRVTIPALMAKVKECLDNLPFEHQLEMIPYFGPIVIGTYLGELGDYRWFKTVDKVVAWFGLDPSVSESANQTTETSHITKRGTKIGRRMMWLSAKNFAFHTQEGKNYFTLLRERGVSFDAAICKIAAKLVRAAYAMLRDKSSFDVKLVFPN
jgi:transposase